jgi:hypothetical protein
MQNTMKNKRFMRNNAKHNEKQTLYEKQCKTQINQYIDKNP